MKKITFTFATIKDLYEFLDLRSPKNVDIKVALKQVKCICAEEDVEFATLLLKASYYEGWLKSGGQSLPIS